MTNRTFQSSKGVYYLAMHLGNQSRRWWSLLYLATAASMLTWGQMLFETYVLSRGILYHTFWGCAFLVVLISIFIGWVELRSCLKNFKSERLRIKNRFTKLDREIDDLIQVDHRIKDCQNKTQ